MRKYIMFYKYIIHHKIILRGRKNNLLQSSPIHENDQSIWDKAVNLRKKPGRKDLCLVMILKSPKLGADLVQRRQFHSLGAASTETYGPQF